MQLIAFSVSLAVFFLVSSVLYNKGIEIDLKDSRLKSIRGIENKRNETENAEKKSPVQRIKEEIKKKNDAKLRGREIAGSKAEANGKKQSLVTTMLQMAGVPLTEGQFTLVKVLLGVTLALISKFICGMVSIDPKISMLIPIGALCIGIILPGRWLTSKVEKKKSVYRDALPDVMDLLVVSVEAGLGFDSALIRLYEKDKSPLMEEMMRAVQDVQHGMSRKEAYKNASERCDVKELTSFFNALIQAEQMGISIKSVLKAQAESQREARRQRAEEKALKAPVKMLVPLVVFIFPVIFIVLLGPALQNILEVFS